MLVSSDRNPEHGFSTLRLWNDKRHSIKSRASPRAYPIAQQHHKNRDLARNNPRYFEAPTPLIHVMHGKTFDTIVRSQTPAQQ
ncbi:hypothetical protein NITLEN_20150 [Nitrospira lenta]|uniref:Uncharacterized protein n=1 Tax=Nitrospira lenta TaxID=1436998 RepID=A0A330L5B8_9BACT|nr:hypothetical protein NITLEN_20150 [Nitrospira lenta]